MGSFGNGRTIVGGNLGLVGSEVAHGSLLYVAQPSLVSTLLNTGVGMPNPMGCVAPSSAMVGSGLSLSFYLHKEIECNKGDKAWAIDPVTGKVLDKKGHLLK
ncbi:MAG: hypothetical protein LBB16_04205 [Puniceicoccales bacterium]|nr:hypothetical protein [Puniceicoccales bacterium]